MKNKFKWVAAIGPGIFLIGYNIGTGSVTTMAKSGAVYGMNLFWALVLSCLFTFILMLAYGKTTLVTGNTALFNFKKFFGPCGKVLAIYIIIALILGELLSLMGLMGIVTDLLHEGTVMLFGGSGISKTWLTTILIVVLYLLLWQGNYKIFEKILIVFVILMALCFIFVFCMVSPSISTIVNGMVPTIPKTPGAFGVIAAMAGTTCSAAVFIMRSTVVAEKGWTANNINLEKKDALVSASMMLFLSGIIMAVSAGTLHVMGLKLTDTVDMIQLFEPIGGKVAAFILILGIAGAGLSTIFPIILIAPWLIADYCGIERNIKSPLFRITGLIGILFGFGMLFLKQRPPAVMIFSQAFQAMILPAVAIPIFILMNKKGVMKAYKTSSWLNIGLISVIIFSLVTTYFAIADLL
jgi:manganese transport protein